MDDPVLSALGRGFSVPVRDPLWGHIYLTPELAAITASAPFMRLSRIFQLGPAHCVYPGATHTRASHSIGVYHLSRRLLASLYERGASWLSPLGVRSFLCAALLHDLGHFPYTHSLKELTLLEEHETLSGRLILDEPVKSLAAAAGADPGLTAAIIDRTMDDRGDGELRFYRRLLSGVLDPDKLDYLNRDARYCGVPYGAQDVDFVYSRLFPHKERGVEIDSRGIPSVESVLFSKYLMYRTVYWHRQVRSATAMIKKALLAGLGKKIIVQEELYGLDDQGLFSLMSGKNFPPFALAVRVREGNLFSEAASFPFDQALHGPLADIEKREAHEEALAAETGRALGKRLDAESFIIDITEPVSFETELHVRDEGKPFAESSSVFTSSAVDAFVRSLRIVRIFTARPLAIPASVLNNTENWLYL